MRSDNAIVQSVIARAILDAGFLRLLLRSPGEALRRHGVRREMSARFRDLDPRRLARFAGFITKVQHNYLWESFPATRTLLLHYGIELDVFTRYRLQPQRPAAAASRHEKITRFLDFLHAYLLRRQRYYPGLRDIMIHERCMWELSTRRGASVPPSVLLGDVRLAELHADPGAILSMIAAGRFSPARVRKAEHKVAYWHSAADPDVRAFRVDRPMWRLLACLAAGRDHEQMIARARGQRSRDPSAVQLRRRYSALRAQGMVR